MVVCWCVEPWTHCRRIVGVLVCEDAFIVEDMNGSVLVCGAMVLGAWSHDCCVLVCEAMVFDTFMAEEKFVSVLVCVLVCGAMVP